MTQSEENTKNPVQKDKTNDEIAQDSDELINVKASRRARKRQENGSMLKPKRRVTFGRVLKHFTISLCVLLVLVGLSLAGVWGVINSGYGKARLEKEAEVALNGLFKQNFNSEFGSTTIGLNGSTSLALVLENVRLYSQGNPLEILNIQNLRFKLRILPLFKGEMKIASVTIDQSKIDVDQLLEKQNTNLQKLKFVPGNPDALVADLFDSVREIFAAVNENQIHEFNIHAMDLVLGGRNWLIKDAKLLREKDSEIVWNGSIKADDISIDFAAQAEQNKIGLISNFNAQIKTSGYRFENGKGLNFFINDMSFDARGHEDATPGQGIITTKVATSGFKLDTPKDGQVNGSLSFSVDMKSGSGKIDVPTGLLKVHRSKFPFAGAMRPHKNMEAYEWEVVSNGAVVDPLDSPKGGMVLNSRLAGVYEPKEYKLTANEVGLRTNSGEIVGSFSTVFTNPSPSLFLALYTEKMDVEDAKRIWPWFAVSKAHAWVVENLHTGTVFDTNINLSALPGRLADDIPLRSDELTAEINIKDTRFDITKKLPVVRDADGSLTISGNDINVELDKAKFFLGDKRFVDLSKGHMYFAPVKHVPIIADLDLTLSASASTLMVLASREPISIQDKLDIKPTSFTGQASLSLSAKVPLEIEKGEDPQVEEWSATANLKNVGVREKIDGFELSHTTGTLKLSPRQAVLKAKGKLNGMAATLNIVEPIDGPSSIRKQNIQINISDKQRRALVPGLNDVLKGPVVVEVSSAGKSNTRTFDVNLNDAVLLVPWTGWSKGKGIKANVRFKMIDEKRTTRIRDLYLKGNGFHVKGALTVQNDAVVSAQLPSIKLNAGDDFSVDVKRKNGGFSILLKGKSMDVRGLIQQLSKDREGTMKAVKGSPLAIRAALSTAKGFGENLRNMVVDYKGRGDIPLSAKVTANTISGSRVSIDYKGGKNKSIILQAGDSGAVLRFLDIYKRMEGGVLNVSLTGTGNGPLSGNVIVRNFWLVNEPRLRSLVASKSKNGDGRSLNEAVKKDIDVTKVKFDIAEARITKGVKSLSISDGVLRGSLIGATFDGTVYNPQGKMSMRGTFMPAYGLNRIFGKIPVLGLILGNGREGGLIGITYKLSGNASDPQLQVNPLSVIAPGIFRQIFKFQK